MLGNRLFRASLSHRNDEGRECGREADKQLRASYWNVMALNGREARVRFCNALNPDVLSMRSLKHA